MKHERRSKRVGSKNFLFGKMMNLDKFSDSVPSFNFRGDQSIKTGLGAFCSILISIIVFYYALLKFIQLEERQNPTIGTFSVDDKYDSENPIILKDVKFKAAFNLIGRDPENGKNVSKDDPNFVKMIVSFTGHDEDGKKYEQIIPHHECTEEEYVEFYPIVSGKQSFLDNLKEKGGFKCIDWEHEVPYSVYGDTFARGSWRSLNVRLAPCNYIGPYNKIVIPSGCNTDL